MPLNSFGAILSFAESLETQKLAFYRSAGQRDLPPGMATLFKTLEAEGEKQIKLIRRTRQENATEMILEPVTDFYKASFLLEGVPDPADPVAIARSAGQNEKISLDYYTQASLKLKALPEVSRTLKQLSRKQTARLEKLNQL